MDCWSRTCAADIVSQPDFGHHNGSYRGRYLDSSATPDSGIALAVDYYQGLLAFSSIVPLQSLSKEQIKVISSIPFYL